MSAPPEHDPNPPPGPPAERFGPFRLLRRLHVGLLAESWRVETDSGPLAGRPLLLKRALPPTAEEREARWRFAAEAALLVRLAHPHLVRALATGERHGLPFVVCELVEGWTLAAVRDALVDGAPALPAPAIAHVGAGVSSGLAALHGLTDDAGRPLGLAHQDVAPDNVLVGTDGRVVLADLGAAVPAATADAPLGRLFTPAYAAPEQRAREPVSARTDIWQLGLALAELLTRARGAAALASLGGGSGAAGELAALVGALVVDDPAARPGAAAAVAADLARRAEGERGARLLADWARRHLPGPTC